MRTHIITAFLLFFTTCLFASQHHIGPEQTYESINDFPWENLSPGDTIYIHYRSTPYKEKWVINSPGTSAQPILIKGVPGSGGQLPVIDGNGATTRQELNYWGEQRSVLKIGGSSAPENETPSYITIESLEIKSGYRDYSFTDDGGSTQTYSQNAASVFIEKGNHITIRSCTLTDSGNGLFIAYESEDILIEFNYIHSNGVTGSFYEHNAYTEASNIIYQYNRFGPLRSGAGGNNLKDRSAGTVIRYNFIQGGNRLMDLVDSEYFPGKSTYLKTYVYGNYLIEEDDGLNNQVVHYGGDSGNTGLYRKGMLYFYHNTLFSLRSGNTTLLRLSSNDEQADVRNNILIVQAMGDKLALLAESGMMTIKNNMMKPGWVDSREGSFSGQVDDDSSSVETNSPQFVNSDNLQLQLKSTSPAIGKGGPLSPDVQSSHPVNKEYHYHQSFTTRQSTNDIGSYDYQGALPAVYRHMFTGEKQNADIILSWETLQEINIRTFSLLHSTDGQSWTMIQQVNPSNSAESRRYQYLHSNPPSGNNLYRLVEKNLDGSDKIINTISINMGTEEKVMVYPSVTNDQVLIRFPNMVHNPNLKFVLYNSNGQLIQQVNSTPQLSLAGLPGGVYYLHVIVDGEKSIHRIIKY